MPFTAQLVAMPMISFSISEKITPETTKRSYMPEL